MKVQVDSLNAIYEDRGDENGDENVCKVDEDNDGDNNNKDEDE